MDSESPFGHGFSDVVRQWDWDETAAKFNTFTEQDVARV